MYLGLSASVSGGGALTWVWLIRAAWSLWGGFTSQGADVHTALHRRPSCVADGGRRTVSKCQVSDRDILKLCAVCLFVCVHVHVRVYAFNNDIFTFA